MPIYLFWGEDDFSLNLAVEQLRQKVLDPNWVQFNYDKLTGEQPGSTIEALNLALTPVFGMGERLVWLVNTTICQSCSRDLLSELERSLAVIPATSHLLFTSRKKPDGRLKSSKLLKDCAQIREFSLIPPWKTEKITQKVQQFAKEVGVKLNQSATELLAESVGNDTRRLWSELEKLSLYGKTSNKPLDAEVVSTLVMANTQNSLKLAEAIRSGNQAQALGLVAALINLNEPALKIVATLVSQFRTWAIVKLMMESGEKDNKEIAIAAEVGNPNRIYYLRSEVFSISSHQLLSSLPLLLELEFNLKRGAEPLSTLQTKTIELCLLFS